MINRYDKMIRKTLEDKVININQDINQDKNIYYNINNININNYNNNKGNPVCLKDIEIQHRALNKKYLIDPNIKFRCYDSRKCDYKTEINNEKFCTYHLKN